MSEVGIAYIITGPDGSRAVISNADAATADADFVGYLDPENGITGLLDTAAVREHSTEIPAGDGAVHGPFFMGRRAGTIQGMLLPNSAMTAINAAETKLKKATRALRADGTLVWTPTGGTQRMLRVRRQTEVRITGRRPKRFQVGLVSADPYALAVVESTITGNGTATNAGDAPTWPRFRINGARTNPVITNTTLGKSFGLTYNLTAGNFIDIYPERGAILLNGTTDLYSALNFITSEWFQLAAGANALTLTGTGSGTLQTWWRSAWE